MRDINDLIDHSCLELLFEKYDNCKSVTLNIIMYLIVLAIMWTGYEIPFFNEYKLFSSNHYKRIGVLMCAGQSFIGIELIILRVWSFIMIKKHQSAEHIEFISMMRKLEEKDHKTTLFFLKLASILINTSGIFGHSLMLIIDSYYSNNILKHAVNSFYVLGYIILIRNGARCVLFMFAYSLAGFKIVLKQVNKLNSQVTVDTFEINQVLYLYDNLTSSVSQMTPLTQILMSTSNLLVIPTFSVLVIFSITPAPVMSLLILKNILLITGVTYSVRGYFLVAIMSIIESESKKLILNINSIIARGFCKNIEHLKRLNMILEDISSHKSRIIIHEFNSPVNQMDFYNSIISTASTVTLIFSLAKSINLI